MHSATSVRRRWRLAGALERGRLAGSTDGCQRKNAPDEETLERSQFPVNTKEHSLAIENELLRSDAPGCLDDQRIATGPVVAVAGEQPDSTAIA